MPCCGGIFDWDTAEQRLAELNNKAEDPTLWSNPQGAQKVMRARQGLEKSINGYKQLTADLDDAVTLIELGEAESDAASVAEGEAQLRRLKATAGKREVEALLSGEADVNDTYLEVHAGAGGTESQDWAEMLLRMYLRWADARGFRTEVVDQSAGEVAGIKSASIEVDGDYAYGWLRTETGVHRLVRKSPFDSSGGRHTSFASVFVYPEVDDSIEIDINPADVRTDTFRASGAGGQHINKTDSAVRLTHVPTGIVVQCQNDRSQHRNRDEAWAMLRSRLFEHEMRKRQAEQQKLEDSKTDVGWGHQIRSYVLDQSRIKDLRTNVEISNTQKVLDGDLDVFITASLKHGL